jgi:F-type H+-transporting ATPase subunit b
MLTSLPLASIIDNLQAAGTSTGWNSGQFFAQCIAVIVLFTVLNQFAWKPVRTILEQRRKNIEDGIANAERIKKELSEAESSRLAILQKANEQAAVIIAEAQKTAAVLGERKTQEATVQAEDIIRKAHEAGVLDRNRLLADLKREVGALVVQTTQKVAGKALTAEDQTRLNDEAMRQIGASNN